MKAGKDSNTEQSILETAERLFLRKGYAMTSTTEIAREVGCNQALVHYYFRTKDKLFEAIFEKKVRLFVSTLLLVTNEEVSFEEKLRKRIEAHFEIIRANPRIPFLFFNELNTNPERLKAFIEKIREIPKSVIDKIGDELQSEIQKELIRNNNQQIRMSMSIENVETKVIHLVTRITDMYMTTEYINNLNINGTGGVVKFPEITSEVKKKDMIRIYSRFRAQISDELVKDLSLVYKLETIDNESFFISNFVAPIYNDQLKEIINSHREREEEIAREIHENFKMSSEEKRFRDIVEKNKSGYIAAGGDPVEFDALMELNKQAAKDVEEYMNKRKFIDSPLISNKDVVHTEKKLSYSQFIEDFKNKRMKGEI